MRFVDCIAIGGGAAALGGAPAAAEIKTVDAAAAAAQAVQQIETGWNTKQAEVFAAPFAVDCDFVPITGHRVRGRTAVVESHRQLFTSIYRESTVTLGVSQVRSLAPDVSLATVLGKNRTTRAGRTEEWGVVISLVLLRRDGAWQIVSFHNTRVDSTAGRPPAPP